MTAAGTSPSDALPFKADGWQGELAPGVDPVRFAAVDLPAILDPDQVRETLYWGSRNLLVRMRLSSYEKGDVAVKVTRNQGWLRKLQRRYASSKAERSWRMARAFEAAGVATPKPVAWVESTRDDGPSLFLTQFEPRLLEARFVFRAVAKGSQKQEYPWLEVDTLLRAFGSTLAGMHKRGLWHRDASIGNLVVREPSNPLEVLVVDLNRARQVGRLNWSQRARDLCRLPLETRSDQDALLEGYGGASVAWQLRWLYHFHKTAYFARIAAKRVMRPLRSNHKRQHPQEHIPRPEGLENTRDKATWDHLTEQPFQHASPTARRLTRLRDLPHHLISTGRVGLALPRIVSHYRRLAQQRFARPVEWPGIGVALGPGLERPDQVVELLEDLGAAHVLLRVYPWQAPGAEVEMARTLVTAGFDLVFALPQNRSLVTDLNQWRRGVRAWGDALAPYGSRFQIGQAINRSKWGVWRNDEYTALLENAREVLPQSAELIGPSVIDFEPLAMASVLTSPKLKSTLSICSSLLYVDRRGAPENRQLGFDAVAKATMMKAIGARTSGGSHRLWITEVNWPLAAGPHSPAGRMVAVDETVQADYAVRYYVPLLASGMVERIYWWQLIARGYGLVDRVPDGQLRKRPVFEALRTLGQQLASTSFERIVDSARGCHLYQFATPNGDQLIVGWSEVDGIETRLPRAAEAAFSRDGEEIPLAQMATVELTTSPHYYWLQPQ